MQLEFHQLARRFEHPRVRHPGRQRRRLGRDGRLYTGYLAIVTSLRCLTGLVIWRPGCGKIGRALIIELSGG